MQFKNTVAALAVAGAANAQGSSNMSICDKYTTALLKNNTAANQLTVLTLVVNTAVIGNYTKPKIDGVTFPDIKVNGILNNGTVNGTAVNLLPYFNGGLASSNRGDKAVSVNFLDDGGAAPLMDNKPANGTSSNQYFLLTHLYQFFGTLLGCSQQGMPGYSAYMGHPSMYQVHKFMDLDVNQMNYFIQQVGMSAASFGVSNDDVMTVGNALNKYFNYRCAPNVTLAEALGSQAQSICIADSCPIAPNGTCNGVPTAVEPAVANASLAMGEGDMTASVTATAPNGGKPTAAGTSMGGAAATSSVAAGAAGHVVGSGIAAGLGLFAFLL